MWNKQQASHMQNSWLIIKLQIWNWTNSVQVFSYTRGRKYLVVWVCSVSWRAGGWGPIKEIMMSQMESSFKRIQIKTQLNNLRIKNSTLLYNLGSFLTTCSVKVCLQAARSCQWHLSHIVLQILTSGTALTEKSKAERSKAASHK